VEYAETRLAHRLSNKSIRMRHKPQLVLQRFAEVLSIKLRKSTNEPWVEVQLGFVEKND
jgi:hypothetical protein